MPLSLEEYATWLDGRDLPWPAPPQPEPIKAKPHVARLPGVRAVLWNVYGTLLAIPLGELLFEHPQPFVMHMALEKTIKEFKMWGSMSRKPGAPSEYGEHLYRTQLDEQRLAPPGEKYPEIAADRLWETIIKKLFQKDYQFDASFYGALNDYAKKVAYFFHASLQGTGAYPNATAAIKALADAGIAQGLLADGQCFTPTQLARGLATQDETVQLDAVMPAANRVLSFQHRARKPSDLVFQAAVEAMGVLGFEPHEILHVGSSLPRDVGPAKKWGMRTALFAGDRASLVATGDQLKDPRYRPDALLTDLSQVAQVVGL